MLFIKKITIFIAITCLLFISSSCQAVTTNTNADFGISSSQSMNGISGNVTVIIYNFQGYYTPHQILEIKSYINSYSQSNKSNSLKFNVTTIDDSSIFATTLNSIIATNNPNYLIIMGAISNSFGGDYLSNLISWTKGSNYDHVNEIGIIDSMRSNNDNSITQLINQSYPEVNLDKSITFANVNLLQLGFIAGVKASLLTKTNKIGLIMDHSLTSSFYDHLSAPFDSNTNQPYDSFNRADFVNGFYEGVYYSSEHLLNGASIEIKTVSHNYIENPANSSDIMANYVKQLSDFHADVIFNMESSMDDLFLQQAKSYSINTGILGDNNAQATYSIAENSSQIIADFLANWNSTNVKYDFTYDLNNSNVLSLYPTASQKLLTIQALLHNGTISLPSSIPIQGVSGFEYYLTVIPLLMVIFRKKLKK